MEQDKKNTLLLAATVIGFAYWIMVLISFWGLMGLYGIRVDTSEIFSRLIESIKDGSIKWLLLLLLIIIAMIAPSILNLIGWIKNSKKMVIVAIILYFLTLNALSLLLCVIGILWDRNNTFGTQEKKKNPLLIIAGILGILGLVFWFVPLMKKADGSSGPLSLFTAMVSGSLSEESLAVKVIGMNYAISLLASFIIAFAISFFGKLRNNSKKVLIAAIFYIISLSIPSAILCFIAYALMKKQEAK